jgi:hypothetical protein
VADPQADFPRLLAVCATEAALELGHISADVAQAILEGIRADTYEPMAPPPPVLRGTVAEVLARDPVAVAEGLREHIGFPSLPDALAFLEAVRTDQIPAAHGVLH